MNVSHHLPAHSISKRVRKAEQSLSISQSLPPAYGEEADVASPAIPEIARSNSPAPRNPRKPKRMMLDLDQLRSNQLQRVYFPKCSRAEDEQLDADLALNVQRDPIHVMPPCNRAGLPAYTILDGHRRAASLRRLGRTSAIVIVRWDLQHADAEKVEAEYLRFNQNRRQLEPLSVVQNFKRQKELEAGRRLDAYELQALDKTISAMLGGMCLRNAQRYLHAADAPPEIQTAFRHGDITLTVAAQVGGLNSEIQQEIVSAIASVTNRSQIRQIISEYIAKYGVRSPVPLKGRQTPKAVGLIKEFEAKLSLLEIDRVHGPSLAPHLPALLKIRTRLTKLIASAKRPDASIAELTGRIEEIAGHGVRPSMRVRIGQKRLCEHRCRNGSVAENKSETTGGPQCSHHHRACVIRRGSAASVASERTGLLPDRVVGRG